MKTTIKKLAIERPTLRFACCNWLVSPLLECGVDKRNIDVLLLDLEHVYKDFSIIPFALKHDVPQCGYKLFMNNKKLIYATDTRDMNDVEAKNFDIYLIEANYDEEELEIDIKEHEEKGLYCYRNRVKETHMSKKQAIEWLLKNMGDNSVYELMHEHIDRK